MKVGYVTIIGKPNVGKSTLMNAIFNKKVSIVTSKAQTTRTNINSVYESEDSQIIFVDTPGIHKPMQKLGTVMNKDSYDAIRGCDVCVYLLDAGHEFNTQDKYLFSKLKIDSPLIIAFNKIDTTNVELIEKLKKEVKEFYPTAEIIEISALEKFNIDFLLEKIKSHLPEGEKVIFTPSTDISFNIAEVIRERALSCLEEEVPHSIYVRVDNLSLNGKMYDAKVSLFVEKDSQKGIVIGKNGAMIKRIGSAARKELEKIYHTHFNISLFVKVDPDWRNNDKVISRFAL